MMRLIKVTSVEPLPGNRLNLSFNDGTRGFADLSHDDVRSLLRLAPTLPSLSTPRRDN